MGLQHLSVCRYISIVLLLLFSFDGQSMCKGDTSKESCNIFSVYWEIHSEDPSSYLAVDQAIIREMKNGTSGLLQLEESHTIELMHKNVSNVWVVNTSYPTYVEHADSSHSRSIDVMLNVSSDAQNPNENYFAIFMHKENFCTNKTVHLLEDNILTLAIVASDWFPVSVNSRFATQLEVSWNPAYFIGDESFITLVLYDVNGMLLEMVSASGTVYTFPALFPCTKYRICLSTKEANNHVCVTGLTDPLPPTNFTVLRANSSGVTVYWDKPALGKYNSFCLEARVIQSIPPFHPILKTFTLMQYGKEFTIPGLPSCQKVNISAWTTCESIQRKVSRTIFAITFTGPSEISWVSHKRTADGMILSWTPPPTYHFIHITVGEKLHGFTKNNSYVVTGLPSCTEHEYKLEALCWKSGSGSVTLRDYTGPGYIFGMKIQMAKNGTWPVVTWKSLSVTNATFGYRLLETPNDTIETGHVSAHAFQLKNLKNDTEYVLEVFQKCQGELGPPSSLHFVLYNITGFLRPIERSIHQDEVKTGQDATNFKTPNYSITPKAGTHRKLVYSLVDVPGSETIEVHSNTNKENYLGSEISVLCNLDFMTVNVSKAYLERKIQQNVKLLLNDGSCLFENTDGDYYEFTVMFEFPFCGGQMLVNETHITFQHQLQNTYDPGTYITRGDFALIWQCVYVRDNVLTVHDGEFTSTRSLFKKMVQSGMKVLRFSKTMLLLYVLTLYMDDSFSPSSAVNASVTFGLSENLYIEVKADLVDGNFSTAFLLRVVSCWATMTPDPEEGQQYFFLRNSCPVDTTFKWHTPKGAGTISRFSIQMFHFASMKESPIYIHCSSNICSYENSKDCLKECPVSQTPHPESLLDSDTPVNSMISAGPITIRPDSPVLESDDRLSYVSWSIITTVSGIVGLLIIFFFGIKIITAILHCQQNRKTYPSRPELMVNPK